MAEGDGALRVLVALAVGLVRSRLPVLRLGLPHLSGLPGAHSRDRAARPQSPDRVQRPDLAGPRRFFRHRRLWRGDSDREVRPAVLGGHPARERGVFRRRLPVRLSRAPVRRPLSRARHLRACGRHARRSSATTASTPSPAARRDFRCPSRSRRSGSGSNPDQWLYLVCLACGAALYWAARNLARGRIGRALIAIRDQPIAAETMGVNAALYKTTCFGVSALYAGVAGGLSAIAVGFVSPESFGLPLSLAFLVGDRGRRPRVARRRAVRRPVHRIRAQPRRPALGQFRRERQGAAGSDLWRAADSGNGRDADGSGRRGAGGGERRFARLASPRRAEVENDGGANIAAKYEGKGESP